ncbi:MAG: glyoxalase [bacterium]|nr:glyoxalase [bacterium]
MKTLFHLAFPIHDFALAKFFYLTQLGCELGRESPHALIFKFGAHQIVAHKVDRLPAMQSGVYPRHFGLIFLEYMEFLSFIERIKQHQITFEIPLKIRFPNSTIEHHSFFLKDPSNNLLEFKYYTNYSAIFEEHDFHQIGDLYRVIFLFSLVYNYTNTLNP